MTAPLHGFASGFDDRERSPMDEEVIRAMARWPAVPAVFGWLRLDRRGRWLLVDRGRAGFDEAHDGAGSPITHPRIVEFIGRNYAADDEGRWYWQNGPQRVYVDIESAPLVLRVLAAAPRLRMLTHTGLAVARIDAGWLGPDGEVLLRTDAGPAVVHDLDLAMLDLAQDGEDIVLVADGRALRLQPCTSAAQALGFVATPRP